ncbi:alpha/beta hydrolase domain-containing protein [Lipingzhangella sp. LS1_29]|uniref:Alpha/beta hydrolase domain-containing protein n=1 Tax=Lipingzhangella rawalii TaxID=2055835 RepID=A0ABU2HB84_9ACTN|nr:alpha/beta hydrolase domain-containing protein [Lipingzhangella rawalii]MDS1271849.1 alpha/beta hydrolase domain-containing protein [Lipingzhangella rawalii]
MQARTRALWRGGAGTTSMVLAAGLLTATPAHAHPTDTPTPATVSGPLATTADNYPFMSPAGPDVPPIDAGPSIEVDLDAHDYVEEEFLLEGTANHDNSDTGETGNSSPYTTRMVVRRPADPDDASGSTFLEWNNVSFGQDIEINWSLSHDYFLRNGHVWVGLSAQRVGVEALSQWNPDRYGDLDVGGPELADAPAFDIYTQAAQALREPPQGTDPLPGIDTHTLVATGHSQSARYLAEYHNTVHPRHEAIDAFMIHGANTALDTPEGTPVMRLMAEGDVRSRASSAEPDTEYFRRWEVAGSSHVGYTEYRTFAPLIARDVPGTQPDQCDRPPLSRIPFHYPLNAAYDHLLDWAATGTAPPQAPRLDWDSALTPSRDAHGNQLGGIRLQEHEAATARNDGNNSGDPFCFLQGAHIPFDDDTLTEFYPNRGQYRSAVNQALNTSKRDGYVLNADARESRANAWEVRYDWW